MTNQVYPNDDDQNAAATDRLVIAQAAHAALLAATVALDPADPADPAYWAVVAHRLTARASLSAALRGLQASLAALS